MIADPEAGVKEILGFFENLSELQGWLAVPGSGP